MSKDTTEFNPLSLESLAQSVVYRLLDQPVHPLPPEERFVGSGIYALYYAGNAAPYEAMASYNNPESGTFDYPIYVGKAVPTGSRKGGGEFKADTGRKIYNRLRQHSRSIDAADDLNLDDFYCRYLVVAPVWIRLAERLIISEFRPVWNSIVDGFGNHDPGRGRYRGERSKWDALHPGRPWADRLQRPTSYTVEGVKREVRAFLDE